MNAAVLSPHYDDAVWSIGATLAGIDATVITVFAKPPPVGLVTAFDRGCGFDSSADAVAHRRRENIRACTVLDVRDLDGPYGDSQYGDVTNEADLTSWVITILRSQPFDTVICPLGLNHPDHVVVANAARNASRGVGLRTVIYEELPSRVWYPEETIQRLNDIRRAGWEVAATDFGAANTPGNRLAAKRAAVECYRSQVNDEIRACLFVPERLWDVTWHG